MAERLTGLDEVRADARYNHLRRLRDQQEAEARAEAKLLGRDLDPVVIEEKVEEKKGETK